MAKQKLDYGFSHYMMFCTLMKDPKACAWLIEKILPGKEIENVITDGHDLTENMTESQIEKTLVFNPASKFVRCDVLFKTEKEYINIEMQCTDEPNLPLRARYYSSQLDMEMLGSGDEYEKLLQKYIIFICTFDPMGLNRPVYTFRMIEEELAAEGNTVLNLNDKSCTIFLNTRCTSEDIPDEIRQFFNFVNENEVGDDPMYEILSRRMTALNEWNNPWRRDIMRLDQEFHRAERKAMEKGMAEGLAKGAREQCIIIAKEMLKDGMKPEKVAELTKLTMGEVEALMKN